MAAQTPNLNLTKPALTDQYSIQILNENSDKIDAFAGSVNLILHGGSAWETFIRNPANFNSFKL